MRLTCGVTKATDTHSEYAIFIAFQSQQWLRERSVIRTSPVLLEIKRAIRNRTWIPLFYCVCPSSNPLISLLLFDVIVFLWKFVTEVLTPYILFFLLYLKCSHCHHLLNCWLTKMFRTTYLYVCTQFSHVSSCVLSVIAIKIKVKCTLVQALRLCTCRRRSRGIALLFLDYDTRRGEGSASHPGLSLPPRKTRYPLYRRLGGPQGRSG